MCLVLGHNAPFQSLELGLGDWDTSEPAPDPGTSELDLDHGYSKTLDERCLATARELETDVASALRLLFSPSFYHTWSKH